MKVKNLLMTALDLMILVSILVGIYQVEGENRIVMSSIFFVYCKTLGVYFELKRRKRRN